MEKAEKGWWKKLVRGDEKTPHYVKVDWDKWADEDDENGKIFGNSFLASLKVSPNYYLYLCISEGNI